MSHYMAFHVRSSVGLSQKACGVPASETDTLPYFHTLTQTGRLEEDGFHTTLLETAGKISQQCSVYVCYWH